MNDNKKKLNEFIDILKWQIDIGADSMVEEKKNKLFLKKVKIDKNQISEDFFSETLKSFRPVRKQMRAKNVFNT